ncbi:alpha-1-macroglobulin-like isoform X1 [Pollicipes pollicipes]|uniref:alpha-1-macroglobulin-like isoform X1 n=1 Tax=Pollicipes pollicipes TaxID=41117 RepID=UPI00188553CE|nr:alpha-1-macroglobulin-like isoform X1 [Pollicipes pollicipes]
MTPLRLLLLCGVVAAGRRYLFTAPKAFFAGTPERVCLTLFDVPETGNLTLTFRRSESSPTFAQHTQQVSGVAGGSKETCFEVQTPELDDFTMWMGLEVTYPSAVNYTISGNQYISVFSNNAPEDHVFIQTDKYVYKPGQVVRFRVLSVNGKLRPISEPLPQIYIESPAGTRVAQWTNVTGQSGLVQLEMQLAGEPSLGEWNIHVATSGERRVTKPFKVEEFVLPRFEVNIQGPSFILDDAEEVTLKVCGRRPGPTVPCFESAAVTSASEKHWTSLTGWRPPPNSQRMALKSRSRAPRRSP